MQRCRKGPDLGGRQRDSAACIEVHQGKWAKVYAPPSHSAPLIKLFAATHLGTNRADVYNGT